MQTGFTANEGWKFKQMNVNDGRIYMEQPQGFEDQQKLVSQAWKTFSIPMET